MNIDQLLASADRLTRAGTRAAHMAARPPNGAVCSFRRLVPAGHPRVLPADGNAVAAHAAEELEHLFNRSARRGNKVPTVVPAAIDELVEIERVRVAPVADRSVLAGHCPVTWLSTLRELDPSPDGRRPDWIGGLVKVESLLLHILADPARVATRVPAHAGHRHVEPDTLIVGEIDDVAACARGPFRTDGRQRTRHSQSEPDWLTVRLTWKSAAFDNWPGLPAETGDIVFQAAGSPGLAGLFREVAMSHVRP